MHRRDLLVSTGLAALGISPLMWRESRAAEPPRRKLLFFTKSAGFQHSTVTRENDQLSHAERTLTDFGREQGIEVTATKDGQVFDSDLDVYDAIMFFTTGNLTESGTDQTPPMSVEGKQRLLDSIAAGKGFLASHCGSDTFHSQGHIDGRSREEQTELDPYIAMLGGEFISHGPQQVARMVVASAMFPGAQKLGPAFEINDEWYSLKNFAKDLHVILVQDTQGMDGKDYERPAYPATWARLHGDGRVFYTSMGHREDVWTNPAFQGLLLGALAWTMRDIEFDIKPNIDEATPGAHVMPPA